MVAFNFGKRAAKLFSVPSCGGDAPGMTTLDATANLDSAAFPLVAANGDEFHLFQIMSARGGNAFPGKDAWIVVVRANDIWSASLPQGDLKVARLPDRGGSFVFEVPPTTTTEGTRCSVVFGAAKTEVLPVVPSHIVRKETRAANGELFGGFHYTGWKPVLNPESDALIIDDPGRCSLPEVGAEGGKVHMSVEITTWSDGRTQVRCLSVR